MEQPATIDAQPIDATVDAGAGAAETAAPRQRKPDKRRARTRAAITSAASALFAEKGLQPTTVDEIAQAAGTSAGTVYFHFGTKEGVAAAAFDDAFQGLAAQLAEARADASPLDRVVLSFEVYFRFAVEQPLAFGLLSRADSGALPAQVHALLAQAKDDVAAASEAGELPPVEPADAVHLIWATSNGLASLATSGDGPLVDVAAAERALALGRSALRAGLGLPRGE